MLQALPVIDHDLVKGCPKSPNGQPVDDGIGDGDQPADAKSTQLHVQVPLQMSQKDVAIHIKVADSHSHWQGQPDAEKGQDDVARSLGSLDF